MNEEPVKVEPIFQDPDNRQATDKLNFNMKFVLTCESSWVSCPTHLDLMYTNRYRQTTTYPVTSSPQ